MPKAIRIIDGKEIELDREIADLIVLMNERGFKTVSCCSGISSDHPYNEYDIYERTQLRTYSALDFGPNLEEHKDKIFLLFKCVEGIGHLQVIDHEEDGRPEVFVEFKIRYRKTHLHKDERLQEFHRRFKEATNGC